MGLSKNELIKKLETIASLYKRAVSIQKQIKDFEPEDNYERKIEVPEFPLELNNDYDKKVRKVLVDDVDHTADNAIEHMSKCYDTAYCPKKPEEPTIKDFRYSEDSASKNKRDKLGCFSYIAAGISVFCLLSIILGTAEGAVATIVIITIVAALAFVFLRFKLKNEKSIANKKREEALAEYNSNKEALLKAHQDKLKKYEDECVTHESKRQKFINKYKEWRKIYLESIAEEDEIEEKLEADRQTAVDKIEKEKLTPALEELLKVNDLISKEYLPAVDIITGLIKSGRADDIKEAINLYEDILYKERQLQLEREKEERRQREEELRRQDEERRYQEDKEFREKQERQRQREEKQRRDDAERRYLEEKRARESEALNREIQEKERLRKQQLDESRRQREEENKQWNAAKKQCQACANAGRCSMSVYNRTPNCTGFRPR